MSSSFNIEYGTIGSLNRVKKKDSEDRKRNTLGKYSPSLDNKLTSFMLKI